MVLGVMTLAGLDKVLSALGFTGPLLSHNQTNRASSACCRAEDGGCTCGMQTHCEQPKEEPSSKHCLGHADLHIKTVF